MSKINEGYIIKPRKILKSDLWQKKPSWWLKVWDYLIIKVNHKKNDYFNRGTNFFTYEIIHSDCKLVNDNIKSRSLDNVIRWLKSTTQITTQKTTRGFIVTICNYELYQNPDNYKNDTGNDTGNETLTKHKRNTNDTINNNEIMKECKKGEREATPTQNKKKFLEKVFLHESEYKTLVETLGTTETDDYIKRLNNHMGSTGKWYQSHYYTIQSWVYKDKRENKLTKSPGGFNNHGLRPI